MTTQIAPGGEGFPNRLTQPGEHFGKETMLITEYFLHRGNEIASHGRKMVMSAEGKALTIVIESPENLGHFSHTFIEKKGDNDSKVEGNFE